MTRPPGLGTGFLTCRKRGLGEGNSSDSDRLRIEQALLKSEERFRQVVESAPNAMVMVNAAGMIDMVNAQAERVFGYSRAEMLGQPIEMLVPRAVPRPSPVARILLRRPAIAADGRRT